MRSGDRVLWIFTTPPFDFVISLEFLTSWSIRREAWVYDGCSSSKRQLEKSRIDSPLTTLPSCCRLHKSFANLLSCWLYANWLIQLSRCTVIGQSVIYCEVVPRRGARTTLRRLKMPTWLTANWICRKWNQIKKFTGIHEVLSFKNGFAVAAVVCSREMQNAKSVSCCWLENSAFNHGF